MQNTPRTADSQMCDAGRNTVSQATIYCCMEYLLGQELNASQICFIFHHKQ